MTTKTRTFELGNILEGTDIPKLEVHHTSDEDITQTTTNYLTPFRGYGFQVSETIDGQWSRAASEFIGLDNLTNNLSKHIAISTMRSMIMETLFRHSNASRIAWNPSIQEELRITTFAEQSYEWMINREQ